MFFLDLPALLMKSIMIFQQYHKMKKRSPRIKRSHKIIIKSLKHLLKIYSIQTSLYLLLVYFQLLLSSAQFSDCQNSFVTSINSQIGLWTKHWFLLYNHCFPTLKILDLNMWSSHLWRQYELQLFMVRNLQLRNGNVGIIILIQPLFKQHKWFWHDNIW